MYAARKFYLFGKTFTFTDPFNSVLVACQCVVVMTSHHFRIKMLNLLRANQLNV